MGMAKPFVFFAFAALALSACSRERLGPPPPGVHKRAAQAVTWYLDKRADESLELGAREGFRLWADASSFKFVYAGKASPRIVRDGRNTVVFERKWPNELPIGAAAWCQAYLDASGNIAEADILLNAQAFSFTTRREAKGGCLYIEDVLAKEIGRSLGIGLGEEAADRYRAAAPGDGFEPGIDPAEMAAYLSLYASGQ
jgi:hypothetical protein